MHKHKRGCHECSEARAYARTVLSPGMVLHAGHYHACGYAPYATSPYLYLNGGVVAHIVISAAPARKKFLLDWRVLHAGGFDYPHTAGRLELNAEELEQMFCLRDTMDDVQSLWLIERYGGTIASQGKFIRWGQYLNIPGPGTGREGDANISVFVSDEIRDAVKQFISERHTRAA